MIIGIGIDSIEVERIERQILTESGLKEKLFTSREIEYCESKKGFAQHFAARFAAKEAFMKALGTGWRDGITFADIEVVNDALGKPELQLSGKAAELAKARAVTGIHVSLTHLKQIATAIVTLEK